MISTRPLFSELHYFSMIHNPDTLHQDASSTATPWFGQQAPQENKGYVSPQPGTTKSINALTSNKNEPQEDLAERTRLPTLGGQARAPPGLDHGSVMLGSSSLSPPQASTEDVVDQASAGTGQTNTTFTSGGGRIPLSATAASFSLNQGASSGGLSMIPAPNAPTPPLASVDRNGAFHMNALSPCSNSQQQHHQTSTTHNMHTNKEGKASTSASGGSLPPFNPASSVSSIVADIASSLDPTPNQYKKQGQAPQVPPSASSGIFSSSYRGDGGRGQAIGIQGHSSDVGEMSAVDAAWSSSSMWTNRGADANFQGQQNHVGTTNAPLYSRTSTFGSSVSGVSDSFAGYQGTAANASVESNNNYLVNQGSSQYSGFTPSSQVRQTYCQPQGAPPLTRFTSTPSRLNPDKSPWAPGNSPFGLGASQINDAKAMDQGFEYAGASAVASAAGLELWRSTSAPVETASSVSSFGQASGSARSRIPNLNPNLNLGSGRNIADYRLGMPKPESSTVSVSSASSSPSMARSQSTASDALLLENPLPPLSSLENAGGGVRGRRGKGGGTNNNHRNPNNQVDADDLSSKGDITISNTQRKKNNRKKGRGGRQTQNRKGSGNAQGNDNSSLMNNNGQPAASSFRNTPSSLVVSSSMLPPGGNSIPYSNDASGLSMASLSLADKKHVPGRSSSGMGLLNSSRSASSEGYGMMMGDRPILPSAKADRNIALGGGGSKTNNHNMPNAFPSQPPAPYSSLLDEAIASYDHGDYDFGVNDEDDDYGVSQFPMSIPTNASKKRDWLVRNNRKLKETEVGTLDPDRIPITAVMNSWAKTKSREGAQMVELWLHRVEKEVKAGNNMVELSAKMYTMAVDAWAKSGEKGAATHAESILQRMNQMHQDGNSSLRPTSGIFNAVINAWARSGEKIGPLRAEQILEWMDKLNRNGNSDIKPDKYSYNTVIHAYAKSGGKQAAVKAQTLLSNMEKMYNEGHSDTKPDTITYNVVINAWAKSGGADAAMEAEKLLMKMHRLYDGGNLDVKPNVVTYGSVIDSWAKSGSEGAAARADSILANMIKMHQSDPIQNADLRPNTYVFNTVINAWSKSKQPDSANKAEDMLNAMGVMHGRGIPGLKPDAFTYTAVIDAWAKSGFRGAATRADQLLEKMEAEYQAGDNDLKPNTFTYNAVINALAKSGEPGAAARAERVLHSMVRRHRSGNDDVKPTTINFNTVLDAFAKSGGRGAAERAEEILEWMDRLNKSGNVDVKPDTITFNAVIDAWARSGDKGAPARAEQILEHMDELYKTGNNDVQPDTYTYNTVINAWAKSCERGSASRAEHILQIMEQRCREGDHHLKPNTRTFTSVIDAWAKSGERGAARRAEQILNSMQNQYEAGNMDVKPNSHTFNAVMNACAFTKVEDDKAEALQIAFRFFERLQQQRGMHPDAYSYTIMLSVCANLFPRDDTERRFVNAKALFEKCCEQGYVNDHVLRKLRQLVIEREYIYFVGSVEQSADRLPINWTRNAVKGGRRPRRNGGGRR